VTGSERVILDILNFFCDQNGWRFTREDPSCHPDSSPKRASSVLAKLSASTNSVANRKEQERGEKISVTAEESRNEIKTVNSKASPQIWTFDSVFGLSTQQVQGEGGGACGVLSEDSLN
jgi:hypothetical protein